MGSWNGTCGVTHLPITCGDDVVLLFLTHGNKEYRDSGMIYPNDVWTPCVLPLYGKYDDYGLIDHFSEKDWNTQSILTSVKEVVIEKELGKNPYHDPAVKKDTMTMENLLEWIRDSRVELRLPDIMKRRYQDNRLGFMMIHKNIYDHLSNETPVDLWDEKTTLETTIERGKETYTRVMNLINDKIDRFFLTLKLKEGETAEDSWRIYNPIRNLLEQDFGEPRLSAIYSAISFRNYYNVLLDKLEAKVAVDDPIVDYIIREYCKLSIFDTKMQILNRAYMPQVSSGQDTDNEIHRDLMAAMERQMVSYEKKWADYDNDDLEDDNEI